MDGLLRSRVLFVDTVFHRPLQIDHTAGERIGALERAYHQIGNVFRMPVAQCRIVRNLAVMVHVVGQSVQFS